MNLDLEKRMLEIQEEYSELKGITFEKLIDMLKNKSFEHIIYDIKGEDQEILPVECIRNDVYEDEDLYEFLAGIGAEIYKYIEVNDNNAVIIRTYNNNYYQIPLEEVENRFGIDIPETIFDFDFKSIKNVTKDYAQKKVKMSKEEVQKLIDATNTVCMYCVEDTLTQEEICEDCPVRKLVLKALDKEEKQN